MTCIAAIRDEDKGRVVIGGDSAGVSYLDIVVRQDPKVFVNGQFLIGCAGSARTSQLLHYTWKPPAVPTAKFAEDPELLRKFMSNKVVESIRTCLKKGGVVEENDKVESMEGLFILGVRKRLFIIDLDFQIIEPAWDFCAIGCGEPYALGSMYSNRFDSAEGRVQRALEAATEFSGGVRPPYTILSI